MKKSAEDRSYLSRLSAVVPQCSSFLPLTPFAALSLPRYSRSSRITSQRLKTVLESNARPAAASPRSLSSLQFSRTSTRAAPHLLVSPRILQKQAKAYRALITASTGHPPICNPATRKDTAQRVLASAAPSNRAVGDEHGGASGWSISTRMGHTYGTQTVPSLARWGRNGGQATRQR